VAVIPVVLFHAHLGTSGGFVGVDVFFVISGYLITSLLLAELKGGSLDLPAFWERRIRRIFPALAVVTLASLATGWFLLLPTDYKELGESVSSLTVFCSNVFFWLHTNYFDGAAESKPLLHTWSLAVEEQFYLLFPLILLGLNRLRRGMAATAIAIICLGSFAISVDGVSHHPRVAFYLLPFRAWELSIGALMAGLPRRLFLPAWLRECLSATGLVSILYALFFYDAETPFPGFAALAPCVGTALFIYSNTGSLTTTGKLLSWRLFVFVGLISYSLYLWHWPVLVFANYWALEPPSLLHRIGLVGLSVIFAFLSYRYVETPFRRRSVFPDRVGIYRFACISMAALLLLGSAIGMLKGVGSRMPDTVIKYSDAQFDFEPVYTSELSLQDARAGRFLPMGSKQPGDPLDLLVWGDSHTKAVLPALDAMCRQHSLRAVAAAHSETPPLLDYVPDGIYSLRSEAPAVGEAIVAFVRANHIRNVLLAARWKGYRAGTSLTFHTAFVKTIAALRESGAKVWVMEEVPNFPLDVPKSLASAALFRHDPEKLNLPLASYRAQLVDQEREFLQVVGPGVVLLEPSTCLVRNSVAPVCLDGVPLYRDIHHLTTHGAMLLQPMFETMLSR